VLFLFVQLPTYPDILTIRNVSNVYTIVLLLSIGIQILEITYLSKEFARVLGPGQIVTSIYGVDLKKVVDPSLKYM